RRRTILAPIRPRPTIPSCISDSFAKTHLPATSKSLSTPFAPKPKSSDERIGVVAWAATGRHSFQVFHIAASKNHVIRFDGSDETGNDIAYIATPLFCAVPLKSPHPDIVLEDAFPVRKMAEFHGLYDAI